MTVTNPAPTPPAPIPLPTRRTWQTVDSLDRRRDFTQGSLALSYPLPSGASAHPRSRALVVVPSDGPATGSVDQWAAAFIQAVIEVIGCDRPLTQLVRWTSRGVYLDVARRQRMVNRSRRASTGGATGRQLVATVHVSHPGDECAEIAARVTTGPRSRAIAARLDHVNGRWICTALTFG